MLPGHAFAGADGKNDGGVVERDFIDLRTELESVIVFLLRSMKKSTSRTGMSTVSTYRECPHKVRRR
jgi:hypothetical protein